MIRPYAWERRLVDLAFEALESHTHTEPFSTETRVLEQAYQVCEAVTVENSRTFHMASSLLPSEKRRAVRALYAFCRVSDDLVDCKEYNSQQALIQWRQDSLSAHPPAGLPVALAWADARARFAIPRRFAEQLIDGVASDLEHTHYESFEDLSAYCYGVASTVGLMSMHIIGLAPDATYHQAIPYAVRLGIALQLTNILRDVGEDARNGRLYLPLDELRRFDISPEDVYAGRQDERWQKFMGFQITRNRRLYAEAMPGIALLHPDGRFAIAAAAGLYQAILEDIERHQADVFNRRASLGTWGKLRRLPRIWFSSRRSRVK